MLEAHDNRPITEEQLLAGDPVLRSMSEASGVNIGAALCMEGFLDVVSAEDGEGRWEAWYQIA